MDLTVAEGISELSTIDSIEIKIGESSYRQIPEPRDLGEKLLERAKVTLPETLSYKDINVTTRKKLPERRKKV